MFPVDPAGLQPGQVVVGDRADALGGDWPRGVTVVPAGPLANILRTMSMRLDPVAVEKLFETARRSTAWAPPAQPPRPSR